MNKQCDIARDIAHDRRVGCRTFALTFGEGGSHERCTALLFCPFLLLPRIAWSTRSPALLLPVLMLPAALQLRHAFAYGPRGTACNQWLLGTFQ